MCAGGVHSGGHLKYYINWWENCQGAHGHSYFRISRFSRFWGPFSPPWRTPPEFRGVFLRKSSSFHANSVSSDRTKVSIPIRQAYLSLYFAHIPSDLLRNMTYSMGSLTIPVPSSYVPRSIIGLPSAATPWDPPIGAPPTPGDGPTRPYHPSPPGSGAATYPPSGASAPTRIRPSTYPTVASRDHNLDPSACGELLFLGRISSVWNRIPSCIGASLSVTSHEIMDKSSFLTNRECCLRVLGPESCGPACPKLRSARRSKSQK